MLTKIIVLLTFTSLAALALKHARGHSGAAMLEEEIAGQLNSLRDHLFKH